MIFFAGWTSLPGCIVYRKMQKRMVYQVVDHIDTWRLRRMLEYMDKR